MSGQLDKSIAAAPADCDECNTAVELDTLSWPASGDLETPTSATSKANVASLLSASSSENTARGASASLASRTHSTPPRRLLQSDTESDRADGVEEDDQLPDAS